MRKKLIAVILAVLSIVVFSTACGGKTQEQTYHNITAQNNAYSMGTQNIVIKAGGSSISSDEPVAKFKESISVSDIEIGQALKGKTVTKVVFTDESTVMVTLDGNTKAVGGDDVYGTITVKQSGMKSKGKSTCMVHVLKPTMYVGSWNGGSSAGKYQISVKITITAGAFTSEATAENINLVDGVSGTLGVGLTENGELKIDITDCSERYPSIVLNPQTTTFNKEYTLKLSLYGSTPL